MREACSASKTEQLDARPESLNFSSKGDRSGRDSTCDQAFFFRRNAKVGGLGGGYDRRLGVTRTKKTPKRHHFKTED